MTAERGGGRLPGAGCRGRWPRPRSGGGRGAIRRSRRGRWRRCGWGGWAGTRWNCRPRRAGRRLARLPLETQQDSGAGERRGKMGGEAGASPRFRIGWGGDDFGVIFAFAYHRRNHHDRPASAIESETAPTPLRRHLAARPGGRRQRLRPIVPYLGLPPGLGVRFCLSHAPAQPVTCNGGCVMPAWYDITAIDGFDRAWTKPASPLRPRHPAPHRARERPRYTRPAHRPGRVFQGRAMASTVGLPIPRPWPASSPFRLSAGAGAVAPGIPRPQPRHADLRRPRRRRRRGAPGPRRPSRDALLGQGYDLTGTATPWPIPSVSKRSPTSAAGWLNACGRPIGSESLLLL